MRILTPGDRKDLRHYGLGLALLIAFVFWGLLPWLGDRPRPVWPLAVGGVLAALAVMRAQGVRHHRIRAAPHAGDRSILLPARGGMSRELRG